MFATIIIFWDKSIRSIQVLQTSIFQSSKLHLYDQWENRWQGPCDTAEKTSKWIFSMHLFLKLFPRSTFMIKVNIFLYLPLKCKYQKPEQRCIFQTNPQMGDTFSSWSLLVLKGIALQSNVVMCSLCFTIQDKTNPLFTRIIYLKGEFSSHYMNMS